MELSGDLSNRRTRSDPSRNVFSLREGEGKSRAPAGDGRNPTARQQQLADRGMWPAISASDGVHGLPALPSAPDVLLFRERKSRPLPLNHKDPTLEQDPS